MIFKIIVQNMDGSLKWEVPYDSFSFTEVLNDGASGTVTFTEQTIKAIADFYDIDTDFIFQAGYREIYIYDEDNNIIFGGFIGEPTSSKTANGEKTRTLAINSWIDLLEARFTNHPDVAMKVEFVNKYAWEVIEELVNYTQALDYGDFGFTLGTQPNDVQRNRTLYFSTIKEAFQKLVGTSVINGIDIDITPQKVINTYYPKKGSSKPNHVLVDGVNIRSYSTRTIFMNQMANEIFVFGEGQRDDMAIEVVTSSSTFKENYFLLQRGISEKDTGTSANLIAKGEKAIEQLQSPRKIPTVVCDYDSPLYTEYGTGDDLPVIISDENINASYRLKQRTLNNQGEVTLTFDETIS